MPVSHAANSETLQAHDPVGSRDHDHAAVRCAPASRVRGDDEARARQAVVGMSSTTATRFRLRNRSPGWRRLALRRPRPRRRQFPAFHGVYREIDRARTPGLHRDLRAVSGRRIGRDADPDWRRQQDAAHRDALLSVTRGRDMVLQTGMEKGAAFSYDRLDDVAQNWLASCELSVGQDNGWQSGSGGTCTRPPSPLRTAAADSCATNRRRVRNGHAARCSRRNTGCSSADPCCRSDRRNAGCCTRSAGRTRTDSSSWRSRRRNACHAAGHRLSGRERLEQVSPGALQQTRGSKSGGP